MFRLGLCEQSINPPGAIQRSPSSICMLHRSSGVKCMAGTAWQALQGKHCKASTVCFFFLETCEKTSTCFCPVRDEHLRLLLDLRTFRFPRAPALVLLNMKSSPSPAIPPSPPSPSPPPGVPHDSGSLVGRQVILPGLPLPRVDLGK